MAGLASSASNGAPRATQDTSARDTSRDTEPPEDIAPVEPTGQIEVLRALVEAGKDARFSPNWQNNPDTSEIVNWRALRESNKTQLQSMSTWKQGRPYKVDNLPERMALAFADFIFNEVPLTISADEKDQILLDDMLKENHWESKLRLAADTCVSEREVWWRVYVDPRQIQWPILEFTSRTNIIPYILGESILSCAFITDLGQYLPGATGESSENAPRYRLLEYHEAGRMLNVLYRAAGGASDKIGDPVALTEHPVTAQLIDDWQHTLPMLAGRVRNEEFMQSIYHGTQDFLLDLNETHTIDSENFRLAGKKRAVMDKKYADSAGNADGSEEIIWAENDFNELDGGEAPFKILEYSYDADSAIKRKDDLERIALTRVGLARQLVDANANEGLAQTGTALRTRLLPTLAAIKGKTKEWKEQLPHVICLMQRLDQLPTGNNGWGRPWVNPATPPAVTLREPFPPDLMEDATRHQTLVNAELESIEEAIYEMRPDWSSDRRVLEVQRIFANRDGYALDDNGNPVTAQVAPGQGSTTGSETPSSGDGTPTGGGASPSPRPPGTTATPAPTPAPAPATP